MGKAAMPSRDEIVSQHRTKISTDCKNIKELIEHCRWWSDDAAEEEEDEISYIEFQSLMEDPFFMCYLETTGLDIKDAKTFYNMVRSVSGNGDSNANVKIDDFVRCCVLMKGDASAF